MTNAITATTAPRRQTERNESESVCAAIACFDDILSHPKVASATHDHVVREQLRAGIHDDGGPVTALLRPRLISRSDHARVCSAAALLSGAMQRLAGYALADSEPGGSVRSVVVPSELERALAAMAPPDDSIGLHARLDAFLASGRFLFVEHNAHPPGGLLTQDVLSNIYANTPAMALFSRDFSLHGPEAGPRLSDNLLHAWEAGGAPGGHPRVAIVDCTSSAADWEFALLRDELDRQGVAAMVCSTDALEYEPGQGLFARDATGNRSLVTVVYRRAVLNDLLARYGEALLRHPLVRAWADGACAMVNSFTSHVAHKKSVLALLSDPRAAHLLSSQEAEAASAHIPWTRLLQPGPTTWRDREVDLLPFVREQRELMVLKPNDDYGGDAVVCGWQRTTEQWEQEVEQAMRSPYVVQQRVDIPHACYPRWEDGRLHIDNWQESTGPYLFGSAAYGCISRLSP